MSVFKLPEGVFEALPEECYNLNIIKQSLSRVFLSSGCEFVETPGIEYYDNFTLIKSPIPQEKMFTLTDSDGRLLVLRPDITLSVARIAATKAGDYGRFCYFSSIYERGAGGVNSREIAQGGVELAGVNSSFADAECIALAIESLKSCGLDNFIIDIGQTDFFKGLLSGRGISEEDAEKIRVFINKKDLINVEILLKSLKADGELLDSIMALPSLFGGREIIERAKGFTSSKKALAALKNLEEVYNLLCEFGYEKYISIDLGMVKSLSYYTGIVFTGMSSHVGASVLTGGRYDNLAEEFGKSIPAVGFAIGLKRVLIALEREGKLKALKKADVLIAAEKGGEANAYTLANQLRESGLAAVIYTGDCKDAEKYAKAAGIAAVKTVKADGGK